MLLQLYRRLGAAVFMSLRQPSHFSLTPLLPFTPSPSSPCAASAVCPPRNRLAPSTWVPSAGLAGREAPGSAYPSAALLLTAPPTPAQPLVCPALPRAADGMYPDGLPPPVASVEVEVEDEQCLSLKSALLQRIAELDLPPNFLDKIIDELGGPSKVAEMTGELCIWWGRG